MNVALATFCGMKHQPGTRMIKESFGLRQ